MNVDAILNALNNQQVDYLLIGGMNFLLRHVPELTFDVDIWVRDDVPNLARLNLALRDLGAEWGATEKEWRPVPAEPAWLIQQQCSASPPNTAHLMFFGMCAGWKGALRNAGDVRSPAGRLPALRSWVCPTRTCWGYQEALPAGEQKLRRMEVLRAAMKQTGTGGS